MVIGGNEASVSGKALQRSDAFDQCHAGMAYALDEGGSGGVAGGLGARLRLVAVVLLWTCAMSSAPVLARTMQQKLDQACAADIARLCAEAKLDQDKIKACMLTRRAEVSPACMALIDASE